MVTNKKNSNFILDKTYLDCIDDAGNCFILYQATLRFWFFKIHYTALIFSNWQNQVTEQSSFKSSTLLNNNGSINFSSKQLDINGQWQHPAHPVECLLYSNPKGVVYWDCHHPYATCSLNYHGTAYHGLGYVETLQLSIKPWQLPIDELRWGRFLAMGISITWIQWTGKNPVNKIYYNGIEMNDAVHYPKAISFNQGKNELTFSNPSIIREVKFKEHLSKIPLLKMFIKKSTLQSVETKYKSKTAFVDDGGIIQHGWSLFEVIQWKN